MGLVISSLFCGILFGAGLAVSGMMNPEKVLGFLDFFGAWDPTLGFVMGGALAVTIPGFYVLRGRSAPVCESSFQLPTRKDIDKRLVGGAVLFGLGWGLAGFCPGPAIAGLATGMWQIGAFVVAMILGMLAARLVDGRRGFR